MSIRRDRRPTWAEIDLGAFEHNVDAVAGSLPDGSRLIAVLKANGYGHGAVELARRCKPDRVATIAVALLEEALELRRAGIALPLLVFGPLTREQIVLALDENIGFGVIGPEELQDVCAIARDRDVGIHLKLDSGMGRMGITESELPRVVEMIRATPRLRVEAIYTHYANADDDDAFTAAQTANFDRMRQLIDAPLHHLANSAATRRGIVRPGDWVRCGIELFGPSSAASRHPSTRFARSGQALLPAGGEKDFQLESPSPREAGRGWPEGPGEGPRLRPVLRWRTEIMRLKDLPAGHAVGYGTTFHTKRPSRIATLPVGYADGYDRLLSNNGEVIVRAQRAPVVGRVSMDLVTIDVTDVPGAALGDEVVLLGNGITADELAAKTNTISYEVFCRISARVPRVYR